MKLSDRFLWFLVLAGLVGVAIVTVAFQGMEAHLRSAGGTAGIVALELASTPERAWVIVQSWPANGASVAQRALWLDFVYIVLYASSLAAACTLIARHGEGAWARWGRWLALAPLLAGALDVIENINLLVVVNRAAAATSPAGLSPFTTVAAVSAAVKFALVAATLIFLMAYGIRWLWTRLRRTG